VTEILVGLIALIPTLLGIANGRRRQLATIRAEIEVYEALSEDFKESKDAMVKQIAISVAFYSTRAGRRFDSMFMFGLPVGWLLLVLGYNLYEGSITDPQSLERFREYAGAALMGVGGAAFLLSLGWFAYVGFLMIKNFRLRRQLKRLQAREKELEAQGQEFEARKEELEAQEKELKDSINATQAGIDADIEGIAEMEEVLIERGTEIPEMPPKIREAVDKALARRAVASEVETDAAATQPEFDGSPNQPQQTDESS
jgi:hypothetical protein